MKLETIFKNLGFGKNAHTVYEALLHTKRPLLVAHLAAEAGISRQEVYRCIEELLAHNFIAAVAVGKRTLYEAQSPRRIEEAAARALAATARVAEHLAKKQDRELPAQLKHYSGFDGIRAVFDDVIEHTPKGGMFYRYTSERDLQKVNRYLSPQYRQARDKKKLERMVISNPLSGGQKRPRLERFIRYIPPEADVFTQNIIQLVYGERVAFINLNTEEAYILEDAALAEFQKVIFRQLYRKL